jgi:hypothetical protein
MTASTSPSNSCYLAYNARQPNWQPLPNWQALLPLPAHLTKLHVVAWLTPGGLNDLLEALDYLSDQDQSPIVLHLIMGHGFTDVTDACECVHDVEAVLLAFDQPQITTLIGENTALSQPGSVADMIVKAQGVRRFLSMQALQFAAEDGVAPVDLPACVLDLAYEGVVEGEPVLVIQPDTVVTPVADWFMSPVVV